MSAFVVTETGVVIEYPAANYVEWFEMGALIARLYTDRTKSTFVAGVPRGCVVSFRRPGVVQQAQDARQLSLENSLELIATCVKLVKVTYSNRVRLKNLKAALNDFDARSGAWKS